jgi:hypothetical protein
MAKWNVKTTEFKEFEVWELPPEGAIPARICALLDVGTQDTIGMNGEFRQRRTVLLGFELGELDSTGHPFCMLKDYALSLSTSSNLYDIVKALYRQPVIDELFDPDWIAGAPCLLQISHDRKVKKGRERTYANISNIMSVPRGMTTPQGSCIVWTIEDNVPLPRLPSLPPVWHKAIGRYMTVAEWVQAAYERGPRDELNEARRARPNQAADVRMPANQTAEVLHSPPATQPAPARVQPLTQAEADEPYTEEDIPF